MRMTILASAFLLVACGSATGGTGCPSQLPHDAGGVGADCGTGGHLAERISTDSRTYAPGAPITVTVSVTNDSSSPCGAPTACPPVPVVIEDSAGHQVWATPQLGRPCPALARLLSPGESVSYPQTITTTLRSGAYSVTGTKENAAAYGRSYFGVC
jgi:hypothetical protein